MAHYSGQHGKLLLDTRAPGASAPSYRELAAVRSWQISSTMSPLDTTALDQTDRTYINGLRSATGSCSLFYYAYKDGDTEKNDCATIVEKLIKERSTGSVPGKAAPAENLTLRLCVNDGTTTGKYFDVEVLLTAAAMSMAVGEVFSAEVTFQVNGAPTEVVL
jgi:hypothetical protein